MRETSLDDFTGGDDEDEVVEPEAGDEADGPEIDAPEADESGAAESDGDDPVADESEADEAGVDGSDEVDVEGVDSDSEPDSGSDQVEPAVSTYDWTPTGADCEACGTAVERRWRDDGRLVCADCKAW